MEIDLNNLQHVILNKGAFMFDPEIVDQEVEVLQLNGVTIWTKPQEGSDGEWILVLEGAEEFTAYGFSKKTIPFELGEELSIVQKIRIVGETYKKQNPFDVVLGRGGTYDIKDNSNTQTIEYTSDGMAINFIVKGGITSSFTEGLVVNEIYVML